MKNTLLFTITSILLTISCLSEAKAQFKVQSNGVVSLGTLSNNWYYGMQVVPNGCVHFNSSSTNDWHWVTMATPNLSKSKCWIVSAPNNKYEHKFYVTGYGYAFMNGSNRASDSSQQTEVEEIEDAGAVIDRITGILYTPADTNDRNSQNPSKRIGVSAQEVEKVLPGAVTADEKGFLYVDYDALTVFLIEAVKEQRKEIELLRKTLEKHQLLNK